MKVTIIGAGNLGTHLAKAFFEKGIVISQVFSRKKEKAQTLAQIVGADAISNLENIEKTADLYLLTVSDDAISQVSRQLSTHLNLSLVVHTSGATSSLVFSDYFSRFGVFYPLQTFKADQKVDFSEVPLCIYGKREKDQKLLLQLAAQLSQSVHAIDDDQRATLHVAAVFANNFTNHLFHISQSLLAEKEVDFRLLLPLIQTTFEKIKTQHAMEVQTGPAIRSDHQTVHKHIEELSGHPVYQKIYRVISKSINPKLDKL